LGIPYQIRQPGGGGTDAGAIHRQRSGIPSVSVSVPGRYIHSPAGIVRLEDWKNELALAYTALARLTPDVLKVAN
jgi:putative aminopeptidase FrvX